MLIWKIVEKLAKSQRLRNFDKSTIRLHYFHIFSMLAKFQYDQRLIVMSSINSLNSIFCSLK